MTATADELHDLLEKQRQLEVRVAGALEGTLKNTENKIVKVLIHSIIMDSLKHADILEAMKDLARGYILSHVEKYEVKRGIEKHITDEKEMLNRIGELISKVDNSQIKNMLIQIKSEEDRHHETLNQLYSMLDKMGDFSEEEWWDYFNRWANFST